MTKLNTLMVVIILVSSASTALAGSFNIVQVDNHALNLSKDESGYIIVNDLSIGRTTKCKIRNWDSRINKGAGMISLTSDRKGVLLYPGKKYLKVSEVLNCNENSIVLNSIPDTDGELDSVVDVNFNKKVFLSLYLIDISSNAYQAKLSRFGDKQNLLKGKGFWNEANKDVNLEDDAFPVTDEFYYGKISSNGQYVAPNDLDCTVNSFPGVWDIESKMKVAFLEDKDDEVIDHKCKELFSGDKTLNELGGKLVNMK
jgi:hypothetical protein